MKTTLIITIVIAVLVAAGAGVGGFFVGKTYQKNHATSVQNDFLRSRGIQNGNGGANFANGGTGFTGQGRAFGGGSFGTVKSVDGNTITLTTAQNSDVTVTLSDSTRIEKTTSGATTDIQPGIEISVNGQRDSSGNITAAQVTILPAGSLQALTGTPQAPSGNTP